jgi:flagellar biosynthesis protein FlgN
MSLDISLLTKMLTEDASAITQLKVLLARERQQLEERKQDELADIITQKMVLLEQLNLNAKRRQDVLQTLQLPTTAAGWDIFLQRSPNSEVLRVDWAQLIADFNDCQAMNEINGKMIARSQQTLNQLLNLLRGKVPSPSLYTAQGTKSTSSSSYTVAKA